MTAPVQRTTVEVVLANHEKRVGILEATALTSNAVIVRQFPFSHTDDVDAGLGLFTVAPGNVLIDYFVLVDVEFTGGGVAGVWATLAHSDGDLWDGGTADPISLRNDADVTTGGLYSLSANKARQMSNNMDAADDYGHSATVVTTAGTMSLITTTGTFANFTAGSGSVFVIMANSVA